MTDSQPDCPCIMCHDYGGRDRLDTIDSNTIGHVEEHGWSVMRIPEDDLGPGWAFTVGLWHSHRQPELAIFGLDIGTMKACLNVLGRQAADGWPPELDYERSHVIDGDPVLFKTIEPRWYKAFFGTALAFYRRPPIPFVQVLWLTATSDSPPTPNASRRCVTGNPASGSDLTSILKVPGPKMSDSRSGRDHRASIHRAFGYDAIHPELYPAGGLVNDHNAKPSQYGSSPISDGPPMRTCRVDRGM